MGKPCFSSWSQIAPLLVILGVLLFLGPLATAWFPIISSCTLPITNRSVAVGCFVPPTCAVGFNRILCNLLFVVIIAYGFFFFFPADFFALWLLPFYVGTQKDPKIILAWWPPPSQDSHRRALSSTPCGYEFQRFPLSLFVFSIWASWMDNLEMRRWGFGEWFTVAHTALDLSWGLQCFWSITREPIEPLVLIVSTLCSSLDFLRLLFHIFSCESSIVQFSPPIAQKILLW